MSKRSEYVKVWRRNTKQRIIDAMGGACQCCGYAVCPEALELHHIYPDKKELSFGAIRASPKAWKSIVKELEHCILICANCHREIHANKRILPIIYKTFDVQYAEYKVKNFQEVTYCPICGNEKPPQHFTCSNSCAGKHRGKVNWEEWDLKDMIIKNITYTDIGELIGISDQAVRKQAKKLGILRIKK